MSTKYFVYGLFDPRKPELIRYVGLTKNTVKRLYQHTTDKRRSRKVSWLAELKADGVFPSLVILEETAQANGPARESYWIGFHAQTGYLTNSTARDLPLKAESPMPVHTLAGAKHRALLEVLASVGGNKKAAAKLLGIGRQTLYNKLAQMKTSHPITE